jgi:predicted neutral ceramidase superfamily lipid hydrolase
MNAANELITIVNPAPKLDVVKRNKVINWALLIVSSAFLITAGSKALRFKSSKVRIVPLLLLSAALVPLNIYHVWSDVKATKLTKLTTIASIIVTVVSTIMMIGVWCEYQSGAKKTRVSFIVLLMNLALAAIVWTTSAINVSENF